MRKNVLIGQLSQLFRSDTTGLTEATAAVQSTQPRTLIVDSPEFNDGEAMARDFSAEGRGLFPTIGWSGVPAACKTMVLVIEDPDAPRPEPFVHGIVYNIPPDLTELLEDSIGKNGASQSLIARGLLLGKNSNDQPAYKPPTPPSGSGPHHYHFQLFALDTKLTFSEAPDLAAIRKAIDNHVLACGELVGTYEC